MDKMIGIIGNVSGVAGIIICLISGLGRLIGQYSIAGLISADSLFLFGTGLMVLACLAKLHLLSMKG